MNTKLQGYIQLAGQTAAQVTKTAKKWVGFLNTASRVYRYPFPDQLMIHSQRPKATACAEFDLWTRRMNRHIRRGSKGIGLVTVRNGYPRLRYVFDIGDTELKRNSAAFSSGSTKKITVILLQRLWKNNSAYPVKKVLYIRLDYFP